MGTVVLPTLASPSTSLKSCANTVVAKTTALMHIAEIAISSNAGDPCVCVGIPLGMVAMVVAPVSNAAKASPLRMFRGAQYALPSSSLYKKINPERARLAHVTTVPYGIETPTQSGTAANLRIEVTRRDMRPEGSGRDGLLSLSSANAAGRYWFASVHWKRWSVVQMIVAIILCRERCGGVRGVVANANTV